MPEKPIVAALSTTSSADHSGQARVLNANNGGIVATVTGDIIRHMTSRPDTTA